MHIWMTYTLVRTVDGLPPELAYRDRQNSVWVVDHVLNRGNNLSFLHSCSLLLHLLMV